MATFDLGVCTHLVFVLFLGTNLTAEDIFKFRHGSVKTLQISNLTRKVLVSPQNVSFIAAAHPALSFKQLHF